MATEGSPALEHHARNAAVFRVSKKSFAWLLDNHHGDDRLALWCKSVPEASEALIRSDPTTYFAPPYLGRRGWVGVCLNQDTQWGEIDDLLEQSYRMAAPLRLVAVMESQAARTLNI
jgi:predicted DNA-binding protein (MmcQ/YjbR family)